MDTVVFDLQFIGSYLAFINKLVHFFLLQAYMMLLKQFKAA